MGVMERMQRQAYLFLLVGATHSAGRLNGRQQERDQNADDRYDDKKFNEGECS